MKHLTGINHLSIDEINALLDKAQAYASAIENGEKIERSLKRKTIITMFFENSTRTRLSFEMAAYKLGASVINWDLETSSVKKNETFLDTILTVGAMKPDAVMSATANSKPPYSWPSVWAARSSMQVTAGANIRHRLCSMH